MKVSRERIESLRKLWVTDTEYPPPTNIRDLLTAIDERDELLAQLTRHAANMHNCQYMMTSIDGFLRGSRFEVK